MLTFETTAKYRRDMKRMRKRGADKSLIREVVNLLLAREVLPAKYNDHALTGNWTGFRECHILPDWLLIYAIDGNELILTASRTGTHSDLKLD
ncbi:MAG: type II toxin-antitoxin system YafQ family toxin [Oscillospiraceae bacterium]|jgi:mRNA interferase YafQ|nr:type II toxin-antitoxin system YafQ family toxin [Oscillospiraceae bacterium]